MPSWPEFWVVKGEIWKSSSLDMADSSVLQAQKWINDCNRDRACRGTGKDHPILLNPTLPLRYPYPYPYPSPPLPSYPIPLFSASVVQGILCFIRTSVLYLCMSIFRSYTKCLVPLDGLWGIWTFGIPWIQHSQLSLLWWSQIMTQRNNTRRFIELSNNN